MADTVAPADMPNQILEAQWIVRARQGDQSAFSELVAVYQKPVFNVCYRMLGSRTDAEDAAQETFIRAFLKLNSYDPDRKFSSWLFSIASHYCIDRLRKQRMKLVSWDDLPPWRWIPAEKSSEPESVLMADEKSRELCALLDALPPDYRAAVVLKYWHQLSYDEIAETLETTVSAIKSKLFRARKMMAQAAKKEAASPARVGVTSPLMVL